MATISSPHGRASAGKFYVMMAAIFVAIAFSGFFMTYWLQVAQGTFTGSAMLHLHGLLFTLWTLFFLSQAKLMASGRYKSHRKWGLLGISLATAMVFVGLAVALQGLQTRLDAGYGDPARAFVITPISGILLFGALVTAAIANLRRPEWHKRLMLVASAGILQAAIARFFFLAATGSGPGVRPGMGPPPPVERGLVAGSIVLLLVVAAMFHDWRTHGRIHPAYWWGFGALLTVQLSRPFIARTEAWYRFTDFLLGF